MKVEIVAAASLNLGNLGNLAQLMSECFPYLPESRQREALRIHHTSTRVLKADGLLTGICIRFGARLEFLGILPASRGQGLGTLLLQDFEAQAALHDFKFVELSADPGNSRVTRFYLNRGYSTVPSDDINLTFRKSVFPVIL